MLRPETTGVQLNQAAVKVDRRPHAVEIGISHLRHTGAAPSTRDFTSLTAAAGASKPFTEAQSCHRKFSRLIAAGHDLKTETFLRG